MLVSSHTVKGNCCKKLASTGKRFLAAPGGPNRVAFSGWPGTKGRATLPSGYDPWTKWTKDPFISEDRMGSTGDGWFISEGRFEPLRTPPTEVQL